MQKQLLGVVVLQSKIGFEVGEVRELIEQRAGVVGGQGYFELDVVRRQLLAAEHPELLLYLHQVPIAAAVVSHVFELRHRHEIFVGLGGVQHPELVALHLVDHYVVQAVGMRDGHDERQQILPSPGRSLQIMQIEHPQAGLKLVLLQEFLQIG